MRDNSATAIEIDIRTLAFIDKVYVSIASLCGIGYVPLMPGTAASIIALIVFFLIKSQHAYCIFVTAVVIISFLVCTRAEHVYGQKDCKRIVIDDFTGMSLALVYVPKEPMLIFIGFWLFRGFDMLKIPPADKIERFPGARGIVGDDLVAGAYACVVLQFLKFSFQITS
jgi:phosphatidylglycerophosphatase A